jgi:predicted dehydrogenase
MSSPVRRSSLVAAVAGAMAGAALTYLLCRKRRRAKKTPAARLPAQPWEGRGPANIAVCGAGWWSQGWHLPHLSRHPNARIAAIVEPSAHPRSAISHLEPCESLGKRYGAPTFRSIDECLAAGIALDGVLVCTSHASHFEVGSKALSKGLHVLMEKPMTTDVAEATRLLDLAARANAAHGAKFMVNNTANWRAHAVTASSWVGGGRIGAVEHVLCVMHSPLLWLFDDPANVGWTKPTGKMAGNGFGYGQASHVLAWIFKVAAVAPEEAYCAMTHSKASGADMTDAAVIRCTNGATICFSGSGSVPGNAHEEDTTNENVHSCGKHISMRIFGSEGTIVYEGDDQDEGSGRLLLRRRDGGSEVREGFLFENYDQKGDGPESVHAFIEACGGTDPYVGVDAQVGMQVVKALDAMYRSSLSGQPEKMA